MGAQPQLTSTWLSVHDLTDREALLLFDYGALVPLLLLH